MVLMLQKNSFALTIWKISQYVCFEKGLDVSYEVNYHKVLHSIRFPPYIQILDLEKTQEPAILH